ncbi:hypothetical protein C8R45DRAFT_927130 [Mycena sanguinolenta]|nr:hypothetical protein C8R45DRAFT_927130 [Mycena sanguinolenta]
MTLTPVPRETKLVTSSTESSHSSSLRRIAEVRHPKDGVQGRQMYEERKKSVCHARHLAANIGMLRVFGGGVVERIVRNDRIGKVNLVPPISYTASYRLCKVYRRMCGGIEVEIMRGVESVQFKEFEGIHVSSTLPAEAKSESEREIEAEDTTWKARTLIQKNGETESN